MAANNHDSAIPEGVITTIDNAISEALKFLTEYATPLTAEDRRNLLKLGFKNFEFVDLAHTLAKQNPQLLSKSFDMEGFSADWADAHNLMGVETKAQQLLEQLSHIRMVAGSEAFHHALEVYADAKAANARNVPDAGTVYERLKAVYPGRKGRRRQPKEPTQE